MADIVQVSDLPASIQTHELVERMVSAANSKAARVAPCLIATDPVPSSEQLDEACLVLIGAIKRWVEAEAGSVSQQVAGPYSVTVDTRQKSSGYRFRPGEIEDLQDICKTGLEATGAYTVDTVGAASIHSEICALNFGALYCSCAADIAGFPLYEV